jgi:hypothetical protein
MGRDCGVGREAGDRSRCPRVGQGAFRSVSGCREAGPSVLRHGLAWRLRGVPGWRLPAHGEVNGCFMLMHRLLWDAAERRPEHLALRWVDRDRGLGYAEAVEAVERAAGALPNWACGRATGSGSSPITGSLSDCDARGLAPRGDRGLDQCAVQGRAGLVLRRSRAQGVVYTHDIHDEVVRAIGRYPIGRASGLHGRADGWQPRARRAHGAGLPAPADPWTSGAIAHLSYTSGTTGKPKGACLCHEPTVTAARCIGERLADHRGRVSSGHPPSQAPTSWSRTSLALATGATVNVMGK